MKTTLTSADLLEDIAGAPEDAILTTKPLGIFSIAQRFFWVAQQETMRDQAVPTPFSESSISTCQRCIARDCAFRRQLDETLQRVPDRGVFTWGDVYTDVESGENLIDSLLNAQMLNLLQHEGDHHTFSLEHQYVL